MRVFESIEEILPAPATGATVVALGTFDGVHRGHRAVIDRCVGLATGDRFRRAMVLTFTDHPLSLLAPPYAPPLLTLRDRKLELLAEAGLDAVACLPFDEALASMEAETFATAVLFERCGAGLVICGYDFRFGRGGHGGFDMLRALGAARGIGVESVEPIIVDDQPISSTRIRGELAEGRVDEAAFLLGRPYDLEGAVVAGARRGRRLEFPTANLAVSPRACVPLTGVYAVRAQTRDGRPWDGMANIGRAPTFGLNDSKIEVHLFGFSGDLYGRTLRVQFVKRLREERKYDSAEALIAQMRRDREETLAILASRAQP